MAYRCFKCAAEIALTSGARIGRRDTCPSCGADSHVCRNCAHYDRSAYNECRESQAERVLEKERSNLCDYFTPRHGDAPGQAAIDTKTYTKALDDLFKK